MGAVLLKKQPRRTKCEQQAVDEYFKVQLPSHFLLEVAGLHIHKALKVVRKGHCPCKVCIDKHQAEEKGESSREGYVSQQRQNRIQQQRRQKQALHTGIPAVLQGHIAEKIEQPLLPLIQIPAYVQGRHSGKSVS